MAVCGELPILHGGVNVNGTIAYVSQQPWIFSGTVQKNILFGLPYIASKYQKVVNACALIEVSRHIWADQTFSDEIVSCLCFPRIRLCCLEKHSKYKQHFCPCYICNKRLPPNYVKTEVKFKE